MAWGTTVKPSFATCTMVLAAFRAPNSMMLSSRMRIAATTSFTSLLARLRLQREVVLIIVNHLSADDGRVFGGWRRG